MVGRERVIQMMVGLQRMGAYSGMRQTHSAGTLEAPQSPIRFGSGEFEDQLDKPPLKMPPKLFETWLRLVHPLNRLFQLKRVFKFNPSPIPIEGLDTLKKLVKEGHPVLLVPNHPGKGDMYLMLELSSQAKTPFYLMAFVGIFRLWPMNKPGVLQKMGQTMLSWAGLFPIHTDAMDAFATNFALDRLSEPASLGRGKKAKPYRPVMMAAEGNLTYQNFRIAPLNQGFAYVGLKAQQIREGRQKKSGLPEKSVVILPVGIRFRYQGNLLPMLQRSIERLEAYYHLSSAPTQGPLANQSSALVARTQRIWRAVLDQKELAYAPDRRSASPHPELAKRHQEVLETLIGPFEKQLKLDSNPTSPFQMRILDIRRRLHTQFHQKEPVLPGDEKARILASLPLLKDAFCLSKFSTDYLDTPTFSQDRLIETLFKLEELSYGYGKSKLLTAAPRRVKLVVDQPIDLSPFMPEFNQRKAQREAMKKLTTLTQERLQALVQD